MLTEEASLMRQTRELQESARMFRAEHEVRLNMKGAEQVALTL